MSDAPNSGSAEEAPPPPILRILGQYVKDLSFEVPQAPDIFSALRQQAPEIPISIETDLRHMSGSSYEVTVTVHLEATVGGKTAFIMELDYGCVIEVDERQVPKEHLHPLLLIEVPRQLFPFIRQLVADMTISGGFPPLMMQLVDFAELYKRKFGMPMAQPEGPSPTIN